MKSSVPSLGSAAGQDVTALVGPPLLPQWRAFCFQAWYDISRMERGGERMPVFVIAFAVLLFMAVSFWVTVELVTRSA
ncbi:hypothetical protein [Mesorhizobium cantuariense]|uniref:Uncharacterized protein n=1 Tax=Mesorhizobium cantuariense TaxID=1300275 RepID=A0ABV7MW37_9HYPH